MTDPGTADRTYIGPMTPELVEEIIANERPDAVLPTMGGEGGSFFRNSEILNPMGFWGGARCLSLFPASFLLLLRLLLVSSHSSTASLVITKQKKQAKRRSTSPRRSPSPASSTSESRCFILNFSWIFFPSSFLGSFAPVLWPSSLVFSPDSSLVG